ncbi:MAG TPA: HEAT repeat domain-containing protein [bacterium]|nr:HEAT repeat domain-containing protein [bacterium]
MRQNVFIVVFLTFSLLLICVPSFAAAQSELEEEVDYLLWQIEDNDGIGPLRYWVYRNIPRDFDELMGGSNAIREDLYSELKYLGPEAVPLIKKVLATKSKQMQEKMAERFWFWRDLFPREANPDDKTPPRMRNLYPYYLSIKEVTALFPLSDEELYYVIGEINPHKMDAEYYSILFTEYGSKLIPYLFENMKVKSWADDILLAQIQYARPYLQERLNDPNPEYRYRAAYILIEAGEGTAEMTPLVLWGLEHLDWYEKDSAVGCLATLKAGGKEAKKIILPWLQDDVYHRRHEALKWLAQMAPGDKETLAAIDEGLASWDQYLTDAAITAIGYQGKKAKRYMPLLIELLQTSGYTTFENLLRTLQKLGPVARDAKPVLLKLKGDYWGTEHDSVSLDVRRQGGRAPIDKKILLTLYKIDPNDKEWHREYEKYCLSVFEKHVRDRGDFYKEMFFMPPEYYLALADRLVQSDSLKDKICAVHIYHSFPSEAGAKKLILLLTDCPQLKSNIITYALWQNQEMVVPLVEPLLQHEQQRVRLAAVEVLGNIKKEPLDVLLAASRNDDPLVRRRAWYELLSSHPSRDLSAEVVRGLQDPDINVRSMIMSEVEFPFHKETIPALVEALDEENFAMRAIAAFRLGFFGVHAKAAAPQIHAMFNDKDKRVVQAAVDAFSRLGPSTLSLLHEDLADFSDPERQLRAMKIVSRNAPYAGKEFPLVAQIAQRGTFKMRRKALRCLLCIEPMSADGVPAAIELLQVDDLLIRVAAMAMLSEVKPADKKLLTVFRRSLKDPCLEIRLLAATALLNNGKDIQQSRKLILTTLNGGQMKEAEFAIRMLRFLGPDAEFAAPALVELAKNGQDVEDALIAIGPAVVPHTLALWQGDNAETRKTALVVWKTLDTLDARIVPLLLEAVKENKAEKEPAMELLAKADPATPGLIAALGKELNKEKSDWDLCELLFKLGPQGMETLIDHDISVEDMTWELKDIQYDKYYQPLLDRLDTDDEEKLKVVFGFIRIMPDDFGSLLRKTFYQGTPKQRRAVVMYCDSGPNLFYHRVDELRPLLGDPSFETRVMAMSLILQADHDDPAAGKMLLSLLKGSDRQQMIRACREMARIGSLPDSFAEAALEIFVNNDDPEISAAALAALCIDGGRSYVRLREESERISRALLAKIKNGILTGSPAEERFKEMLPEAFPAFLAELRTADKTQRDRLLPLAKCESYLDSHYLPRLRELTRDKNEAVRLAAIRMMGSTHWEFVKPTLLPFLTDKNADVQASVIFALDNHKSELIRDEECRGKLTDENPTVRLNMLRIYSHILAKWKDSLWEEEHQKLTAALQPLTQDANADVRAAAQEALKLLSTIEIYKR